MAIALNAFLVISGIGVKTKGCPNYRVHKDSYQPVGHFLLELCFIEVPVDSGNSTLHNGRYVEHWTVNHPGAAITDHPVTFVSWHAAVAYCTWRGKRLPSEAEYEWAAQDGASRFECPWGDTTPSDERVNWGGDGIDGTVPVGTYPPNARGLYDMSGNVWHFTADPWVDTYSMMLKDSSPTNKFDDTRIRQVVRGGSYGANAANLRVRYRDSHRPFDARVMVGFRCALSAGSG